MAECRCAAMASPPVARNDPVIERGHPATEKVNGTLRDRKMALPAGRGAARVRSWALTRKAIGAVPSWRARWATVIHVCASATGGFLSDNRLRPYGISMTTAVLPVRYGNARRTGHVQIPVRLLSQVACWRPPAPGNAGAVSYLPHARGELM